MVDGDEESQSEEFNKSSERKLVRKRSSVIKREQLIEESNKETAKLRKQSSFTPSMVKRLKTRDQEEERQRIINKSRGADRSTSRSPET